MSVVPEFGATLHHKLDDRVEQVNLQLPAWEASPQEVPSGVFMAAED